MRYTCVLLTSALLSTAAAASTDPVAVPISAPVAVTPISTTTSNAAVPDSMHPVAATLVPNGTESTILRAGTPVPLKLLEILTTKGKMLRVGQRFQMEVSDNVMLGSNVVIPVGSPAVGEITDVRNKGMWGRSGKMNARALYARVNGRQIRLTGQIDDKGVAGGIAAVAVSGIVFLPAGFFMTGTSATLPIGTPMKAFLDEDIQIAIASPPLMAIPATAAPVTITPDAIQSTAPPR